jgi:hypothetical protein
VKLLVTVLCAVFVISSAYGQDLTCKCRQIEGDEYLCKCVAAKSIGSSTVTLPAPTTTAPAPSDEAKPEARTDTPTGETTKAGQPIYVGPRGGHYHYSSSGKKVYERRK